MIKLLTWDSSFFGYKIGESREMPSQEEVKAGQYDLVYVRSTHKLNTSAFCDHRVQFKKAAPKSVSQQSLKSLLGSKITPELLKLAEDAGIYSRFKLDPGFQNNEFKKLYHEWLLKSLSGEMANEVFAHYSEGSLTGFVTVKLKENAAHIGLIAVSESARGQGVGLKLINAVEDFAYSKGMKTIHVPTQNNNEAACSFYKKCGFSLESEEYVYHLWTTK